MTQSKQYACIRCARKFLSVQQLYRHYEKNPKHREPVTIDASVLAEQGQTLKNQEWVDFDDRVETFLRVATNVDPRGIKLRYYPDNANIDIIGNNGERQTLDVSDMQEFASNNLQWSYDGEYLLLAFLK